MPASFHLGALLHDYIERSTSMRNGANVAAGMIASKTTLLQRLDAGFYPLPLADIAGLRRFLQISLIAEAVYDAVLAARLVYCSRIT
ncbi:MAG: hypothetical protein MO846_07020 [Candidatus Devosia symbiotica]|nr:hypothetical protein [Candidatus Devosia symbiotica]